jgi:hypothetical protein
MKSFKSFLRESEEIQGIHTLFHPVRGMYNVHKSGEFHHVKNNEGEVTHTFVRKTDDEVLNILKHEHDLIYAGKLHEDYITELKAPKPVLSDAHKAHDKAYADSMRPMNDARGRYNEAMTLYHLNGKKWINTEHKKLGSRRFLLTPNPHQKQILYRLFWKSRKNAQHPDP